MKNRLLRSLAMLVLCSSGAAANTIGNLVFHDVNDNGVYDLGTDGTIDGVTLQLFNAGDDPTVATPVATATSGGGGIYSFAGVADGTYFIYIPLTEFVHGKVLFDKTTATGAPDPGDAVDNDDNGKIEETHRGTITDDFSVSGGGTVNTIDFGFITRVLIDWDDPNNQWDFVGDTPEGDGSITSTGDLDGTGNPYFTDISGTGVDMGVTLEGQDPDGDLTDGGTADTGRDELTEWLNQDPKHAGIIPLFQHLGGEATFNLGYGEGTYDDCLEVTFDFTDTVTGAPVAVKDVSFKIFDIDKSNWSLPGGWSDPSNPFALGFEDSNRGLGWIDSVTIQGYAGASLVDPIFNHVNGASVDDPVNNPYSSEPDGTNYMKVDGNTLEGRWEFSEKQVDGSTPESGGWNHATAYDAASGNVDVSFASPITKFTWKHENIWSDADGNRISPDPYWGGHSMEIGLSDIAFTVTAALGDYVWIDLDRDGEQDPLEPPLEGVLVELLDDGGTPILTTTTDASGAYFFADIPLGDYTVRFTPPVGGGYTASPADQGGDDALDSDINGSGVTGVLNITSVQTDITVDAGFIPPGGVLGDFVFLDANADGEQDPGEPGIEGVTVNLLDEFGDPVLDGSNNPITTTTNADGVYWFDGLTAGTYTVEFVAPALHVASPQDVGSDDTVDSDLDPVTFTSGPIVLGTNESNLTVDAGFYELASIGDRVFNDVDGDGVQDAGEIGLPGVTVYLLDGSGNPVLDSSGNPITTTTDASGAYLFEGLAPGDYIIEFVTPDGFTTVNPDRTTDDLDSDYDPLTGQTAVISVGPGDDVTNIDGGFRPPARFAQVGDTVWDDLDGDGIQDSGEPGVEGVVVTLLDDQGDPILDADGNETTVTTDANGNYLFIVDPNRGYILEFEPPPGSLISPQGAGSDPTADSDIDPVTGRTGLILLANDEVNLDIDAGIEVRTIIGDTVWMDLDRDGVQDPGEAGLEGVTVELLDAGGNPVLDGSGNPITATTDANGYYELVGFDPGIYQVRFTDPGGRTPTGADQGGDDRLDSDIDALGVTGLIDMTGDVSDITVDAGYLPNGSAIGDTVFNDANGDGIQDPGETGLAGVTVNLLDGSGNPVLDGSNNPITTTTDADGNYYFDGLTAGDYIVEVIPPQDYAFSPQNQGGDDTADSDIDPATNQSGAITLGVDTSDTTVDAGLFELASIGDYVFNDANNDGKQDSGEIGLPGVVVNLLDSNGDPVLDGNNDPITTTSDASGFYEFTGLPAGDYRLEFVTPAGFLNVDKDKTTDDLDSDYDKSTGITDVITLTQGETNVDVDAGFDPPGNFAQIGDTVWEDLDGDGIQDPGELGVEGVVVKLLDFSGTPILDANGNETTVTTDANGNYLFIVDPDFDYILEFVPPAGMTLTSQDAGSDDTADSDADPVTFRTDLIMLENNEVNLDIDAGLVGASIGDTVWVDLDGDGVQDPNEAGLEGVTVELLDSSGAPVLDGSGNPITATTDATGNYELTGFPPGIYQLRFTPPDGQTATGTDLGGDDALDSDIDGSGLTGLIDMTGSGDDITVDAGFLPVGSGIGDVVFNDLDGDGVQDPGEPGVEGVTVNLLDASGNPVLDGSSNPITTTTNANGAYFFDGLSAGDYIVEVVPPQDWAVSPQDQGGDDAFDSDLDPATNQTGVISLGTGVIDTTVDAGLFELASIGDFVFNDENKDGKQDAGEIGLPGVVVNLLDSSGNPVLDGNNNPITTTSDGSGFYEFTGLPAGDYILEFVTPNGYLNVDKDKTTDDLDSDYDKATGLTDVITLTQGEENTDVDAGFDPIFDKFAQLGSTVWEDLDGDGIQDPGEPGVEGVVVKLLDDQGNPILDAAGNETTVTTDSNGDFLFVVDPDFDYILEFVPPPGESFTTQGSGSDGTVDSDVDPATNQTGVIAIADDEIKLDIDAGIAGPETGVIGNYVWLDEDGDGLPDAGEAGIPDVTVHLRDSGGNIIATTTTDANGGYIFTNVLPGDYTVEVDGTSLPTGLILTGDPDATEDGQHPVTLGEGEEYLAADFGYNFVPAGDSSSPSSGATGSIGDTVWNDADGDGVQDPGESGLEGVTVTLLTDDNGDGIYGGAGDNPPTTTTTDASGNYVFDGLAPGGYVVEVTPPAGYTQTGDPDGILDDAVSVPIVLAPGDVITIADFGYDLDSGGAIIGDTIYLDVNGNGTHDPGTDLGIPGVTVALLDAAGNVIATTTTDENGIYSFPGLPTGVDYTVVVTDTDNVLGGLVQSGDPDGGNDGQSTVISLGVLGDDTQDFGYTEPGHTTGDGLIGDTIYLDSDGSGGYTSGEGVEGITVELWDATGTVLLATTTTDENGNYSFGGLDPAGTYTVRVNTTGTILAGTTNFDDPDGGGDSESVIDLSTDADGIVLDQDFGYTGPNTIGGTIWDDTNADGTLNESGNGIEGVTVVLLDTDGNVVATTTTDANGDYSFTNVPDGSYTVDVTDDSNVLDGYWHSESGDQVSDGTSKTDPYIVTVIGGATNTTGDFGYYQDPAVLGNVVWHDLDGDGIQDGGEPGIPGVVVTLTIVYPNGDTVVVSTTTAPDGSYTFIGLLDESFAASGGVGEPTYTVTVATPDRYAPSPSNVGGDDTIDSDDGVTGEEAELVQGGEDLTNDFGFVKLKATNYNDFITDAGLDPAAVDGSGQPLPDGSGTGGNPDGDYSSNLLEHAFCDTPNSGVPNHQGFCVELANAATGQMDASFIRAEGIEDVIYTLQGADSMLGPWFTIDTIPAGQPAGGGFVAVSNGDQTETVTYANVQDDAGYANTGFGFARLCVSLDSEPDGTPDTIVLPSDGSSVEATDYTRSFGWQCVDYNVAECASSSQPFSNKPAFSGTVDGNAAATATVDATGSAGGVDLAALNLGPIDLDPGPALQLVPTHYLQITSGLLEGERFDIASASGGVLTLVDDPDIFAAGDGVSSLNTSSGVPADGVLAGASFQVLPHKTIDQLFDKTGAFAGLQSVSDETRLLFYNNRVESPGFETLSLADTGSGVKWVSLGDSNEIDQGRRPVDRCTGNYVHSLVGGTTVCGVGLVADYDIACPFNAGYNLAGAPYPLSQTPNGIDGRAMSVGSAADEFNGAASPSQASELFQWRGDLPVDSLPLVVPYIEGYETFMAASDGGTFEQWVNPTDPTLADLGSDPAGPLLLASWRAVTVKMLPGNALVPHIYPLPTP